MSDFWIRTLSGAVYVALIVLAVFAPNWITALIFSTLAALTVYEFHKLTNKLENVDVNPIIPAIASFMLVSIYPLMYCSDYLAKMAVHDAHFLGYSKFLSYVWFIFACVYCAFCLYVFISEIFRNKPNPVNNIAYTIFGQIYIVVPFLLIFLIKEYRGFNEIFLLAFFVLIWTNDTFAYLVGTKFGKHRMCEHISPKKSWEGFIGGLIGALAIAFVFSYIETQLNAVQWLGFAAIVVIFGTLGDLLESVMKRTIGVKDSGTIMPGHGGFLDRFDSLLLATPVVFIYLLFVS